MRSPGEILAYISADDSLTGDAADVLMDYLSFDDAKALLKPGATEAKWHVDLGAFAGFGPETGRMRPIPTDDRDFILAAMRHYAAFGWGKVTDHRGISASRTIGKMAAWLWLLDDTEAQEWCHNSALYRPYGAPTLKRICDKYGFPIPPNAASHADGQRCSECHWWGKAKDAPGYDKSEWLALQAECERADDLAVRNRVAFEALIGEPASYTPGILKAKTALLGQDLVESFAAYAALKASDHDKGNRANRAEMVVESLVLAATADFTLRTLLGDLFDEAERVLAARFPSLPEK